MKALVRFLMTPLTVGSEERYVYFAEDVEARDKKLLALIREARVWYPDGVEVFRRIREIERLLGGGGIEKK